MTRADETFFANGADAQGFVDEVKKRIAAMSAGEIDELMASFDDGAGGVAGGALRSGSSGQHLDEMMADAPSDTVAPPTGNSEQKGDSLVVTVLKQFAAGAVENGTLAHSHAEKLIASARWDLGSLQDTLAAIPLYKDRKSYLRAMAQKHRPRAGNSFYKNITFEVGAHDIFAYFKEASNWLTHFRDSIPREQIAEMLRKPRSIINTILTHMMWTVEFLTIGRRDMEMTRLPEHFWADVLPLVGRVVDLFDHLSKWKECEVLRAKGMVKAEDVLQRSEYLKGKRERIGREMREREAARERVGVGEQATSSFVLPVRAAPAGRD